MTDYYDDDDAPAMARKDDGHGFSSVRPLFSL
jgi:hypothetical protein